jgi:hypothetical protein
MACGYGSATSKRKKKKKKHKQKLVEVWPLGDGGWPNHPHGSWGQFGHPQKVKNKNKKLGFGPLGWRNHPQIGIGGGRPPPLAQRDGLSHPFIFFIFYFFLVFLIFH